MAITVLYGDRETKLTAAPAKGEELWLSTADAEKASGWEASPEGMCRGEACVPVPKGARWMDEAGGRIDLAGFARHMGQPAVHDAGRTTWAFGDSTAARRAVIDTLEAPDFALPDLDGRVHRLSDYRGKKVFLFSWGTY